MSERIEQLRGIAKKAKGEYEAMAGFPGSGYVSRLGHNLNEALDLLQQERADNAAKDKRIRLLERFVQASDVLDNIEGESPMTAYNIAVDELRNARRPIGILPAPAPKEGDRDDPLTRSDVTWEELGRGLIEIEPGEE